MLRYDLLEAGELEKHISEVFQYSDLGDVPNGGRETLIMKRAYADGFDVQKTCSPLKPVSLLKMEKLHSFFHLRIQEISYQQWYEFCSLLRSQYSQAFSFVEQAFLESNKFQIGQENNCPYSL